jgi:pimeloyl-[acyl-carrier protein] synthase
MSTQSAPAACPVTLQALVKGYTDPHALYDGLREHDRVSFDPAGRCWLVSGHGAVRSILGDERFVSDATLAAPHLRRGTSPTFLQRAIQHQVIFADDGRQARVQRAVLVELSRRSESLAAPLRAAALALAERAREQGGFDLVRDFAIPFSMQAISMVLGLPLASGEEGDRLERWSSTFADLTSGYLRAEIDDITHLGEYLRERVAERRGTPSDDLIGAFMRDGGLNGEEDIVIQCMMAFAAGRVTTQKLLGSGVPLLLPEWSAWREQVRENPPVVRRIAEELLRVVTPTRYLVRYAAAEVALAGDLAHGATIRQGDKVVLFLEAANRDPQAFPDPHTLMGDRQPNAHVAFGFGAHRCPGASVARMEIQVALQVLLDTLHELRPDPATPPTWEPNPNLGGYASYRCLCA